MTSTTVESAQPNRRSRNLIHYFEANSRALQRLLFAAILLLMVLHLVTLTIYPRVFIDEGWLSNSAWSWLTTGVHFDAIHSGTLDQFGYEWVSRFTLGEAPYALSFGIFGLGLFQERLVAWAFGGVLLFATIQVARRTYGLTTGLLAALLLALSLPFLQSSRYRQDIMLSATIMVSVWLALMALQENKTWAHFVAGFLVGVGLDIHQSAVLFVPALAVLYLVYYGKSFLLKRGTWAVAVGGALGLGLFLAIHILPSPDTYSKLMSFNFVSGAEAELPISKPATLLSSALGELGRYGFRRNPVDLLLIIAGGIYLLYRRSKPDYLILAFSGVAFLDFILLSGDKTALYAIHLYPFFLLIVAELLVSALRWSERSKLLRIGGIFAVVLYVGYGAAHVAYNLYNSRDYDYYGITGQIREVIPPDARVMGMPMWWFGLADYDYRSSLLLPQYAFFNGYSAEQALEIVKPDYLIFDEIQSLLLVDEGESLTPGMNAYRVSREAFMEVLDSRGTEVLEFQNPYHGAFKVYALDWSDSG